MRGVENAGKGSDAMMAPKETLVGVTPGNRCWYCQDRPLPRPHPHAVHSLFNEFLLLYLVCSPSCAHSVVEQMSLDGVSAQILRPEEVGPLLRELAGTFRVIEALETYNLIFGRSIGPGQQSLGSLTN